MNIKVLKRYLIIGSTWLILINIIRIVLKNNIIYDESFLFLIKTALNSMFDIKFSYFFIAFGLSGFILLFKNGKVNEQEKLKIKLEFCRKIIFILFIIFFALIFIYYIQYIIELISNSRNVYQSNPEYLNQISIFIKTEIIKSVLKLIFILFTILYGLFQIKKKVSNNKNTLYISISAVVAFAVFQQIYLIIYYFSVQVTNEPIEQLITQNVGKVIPFAEGIFKYSITHLVVALFMLITIAISCIAIFTYSYKMNTLMNMESMKREYDIDQE